MAAVPRAVLLMACLVTIISPALLSVEAQAGKEGQPMAAGVQTFRHGLRYDPMKFVENDRSLQGALVRTFVFAKPTRGDEETIQIAIEKRLARAKPDRPLRAEEVLDLLALGLARDHPEVQRAIAEMSSNGVEEDGTLGIYKLRAVCLSGGDELAELRDRSLRKLAEQCRDGVRGDCPWTPIQHLKTLWAGREFVDVEEAMATDLRWIVEGMNEIGCLSYKDPWGFVDLAAVVRNEHASRIAAKLVPMILRTQREDGGWGGNSLNVFRLLVDFGLLGLLRDLPPLPPDWRIVRSVPAPEGKLVSLAHDGERLWTCDPEANEVIALSPEDGSVLRRLILPDRVKEPRAVGIWNGALAVVACTSFHYNPETGELRIEAGSLFRIHAKTGAVLGEIPLDGKTTQSSGVDCVDGRLWVADHFDWVVTSVDPGRPEDHHRLLLGCPTGGGGTDLAAADDGVWHFDGEQAFLVKSAKDLTPIVWRPEAAHDYTNARLIDWGEKPFGDALAGIAFDGEHLWALDAREKRICVIEKVGHGE